MLNLTKGKVTAIICGVFAIICLCLLGSIGEDVKNERIVVNQYPFSGKMAYWTDPGFRWQWFGHTTEYYKTQQFWFGGKDVEGESHGTPIKVIFNDASVGYIYGSLRVVLPTDVEHLRLIQTAYNGMDRLMNDLVAQNVVKVIYASGPLMSAFESYAEKKNDMVAYITDQLTYGVYKTTVKEEDSIDSFTGETKKVKVASLVADENAPNGYVRSEKSPFTSYGVIIDQVSITEITYDEKVKATEVTKAEQEREVARLAAEKAEFDKKKIIAEGEAEAAANRAKVAAGLTPQERAEWEYKTKVGVAEALSKTEWPKIVMNGNQSGGNTAMDAIALKQMTDLVEKMSN